MTTISQVAQEFVACINAHDVDGILQLCSPDHVFIDSLGTTVPVSRMGAGWQQYFQMVPDYWIKIDEAVENGDCVLLIGSAGGTYAPGGGAMSPLNQWQTPAAFRAHIARGKVLEWRVYCDNEPIREKMRAAAAQPS